MSEQWNDSGTPLVSPDAKFRADLHRALQDTHQRQQVQRRLYGAPVGRQFQAEGWRVLVVLGLAALVFALGYWFGQSGLLTSRHGSAPAAPSDRR